MSGNTLLFRQDIEPILQEAMWIFQKNAIEKGSSYLTCDLSFLVDKFNEEVGEVQELNITETMCRHDKKHAIKELCDTINQSFMLAYRLRESMKEDDKP